MMYKITVNNIPMKDIVGRQLYQGNIIIKASRKGTRAVLKFYELLPGNKAYQLGVSDKALTTGNIVTLQNYHDSFLIALDRKSFELLTVNAGQSYAMFLLNKPAVVKEHVPIVESVRVFDIPHD